MRTSTVRKLSVTTTAAVLAGIGAATWLTGAGATAGAASVSSSGHRCDQPGPYDLPHTSERVDLDPADFTTRIDNRYWPMVPGTTWVSAETDPGAARLRVEVTVTHRTRTIRGIEARVVHDAVTEKGELVENTFDWYAQDSGGSIWYLGEHTREYENGHVVSSEGSFEYGVDGAQAGVVVPADPVAGCSYRQEYYKGEAVDRGRILTVRDDIKVSGERYRNVLTTSDRVPLEPFVLEHKFYARGVGPVEAVEISPGASRELLLSVTGPGR